MRQDFALNNVSCFKTKQILKQCLFVIGVPGSEHVFIRV